MFILSVLSVMILLVVNIGVARLQIRLSLLPIMVKLSALKG